MNERKFKERATKRNPLQALVKDSHPQADEKRAVLFGKIQNEDDITQLRYVMTRGKDSNYPVSMSDCEVVGINGDCGTGCPVFLRGECYEHQEDMLKQIKECIENNHPRMKGEQDCYCGEQFETFEEWLED